VHWAGKPPGTALSSAGRKAPDRAEQSPAQRHQTGPAGGGQEHFARYRQCCSPNSCATVRTATAGTQCRQVAPAGRAGARLRAVQATSAPPALLPSQAWALSQSLLPLSWEPWCLPSQRRGRCCAVWAPQSAPRRQSAARRRLRLPLLGQLPGQASGLPAARQMGKRGERNERFPGRGRGKHTAQQADRRPAHSTQHRVGAAHPSIQAPQLGRHAMAIPSRHSTRSTPTCHFLSFLSGLPAVGSSSASSSTTVSSRRSSSAAAAT
jgi:hypothetical protein